VVLLKKHLNIVGANTKNDRVKNDFYPTPIEAIEALLRHQKFDGDIWECACGDGAISNVLLKHGYRVFSSDLVDRGFGTINHDFLTSQLKSDNIITNPPFNLSLEFALKALQCVKKKAVFFHKLVFLESKKRYNKLFKLNKLEKVLIMSGRLAFKGYQSGGLMCFAWFIFDVNYNGKPTIDWI
jgi:hypothetical protein